MTTPHLELHSTRSDRVDARSSAPFAPVRASNATSACDGITGDAVDLLVP